MLLVCHLVLHLAVLQVSVAQLSHSCQTHHSSSQWLRRLSGAKCFWFASYRVPFPIGLLVSLSSNVPEQACVGLSSGSQWVSSDAGSLCSVGG